MSKKNNLKGKRFGRLVVLNEAPKKGSKTRWYCVCDCGKKTISHTTSLTSGKTKSCGCLSHEKFVTFNTKHGMRKTRIYSIYCGMKKRCFNKNYEHYNIYGGRGITVCDEWLNNNGFLNFYKWSMKNGYNDKMTIDRIDVNGNYEPSNCRWVAQVDQVRNRTNSIRIEYKGLEKSLKEWCELYSIGYKLAYQRYKKGWAFKDIFNINR